MSGMVVRRVSTGYGSRIEPPFNHDWSRLDQLRWVAAVTALDTGLPSVEVERAGGVRRRYVVRVNGGMSAPLNYWGAWTFLDGVRAGAMGRRTVGVG